jgi:hypothetical protein
MPVDRARWKVAYYADQFLTWTCGVCGGKVALRENRIIEPESVESRRARDHDAWEPEWIHGRFSALLACGDCANPAFVVGFWRVDELWEPGDATLLTRYHPEFVTPAPDLIQLPARTPEAIADELKVAFSLFWFDPDACGNRIRSAVERLLDDQRVQKVASKTNRSTRLTLHRRLDVFRTRRPEVVDLLMAVKWIGNAASHGRSLARDDLFDGFDLLEQTLGILYAPSEANRIAKQINRRKKPRGTTRRKPGSA